MNTSILTADIHQIASLIATLKINPNALSPFDGIEASSDPAKQPLDKHFTELVSVVCNPTASILLKSLSAGGAGIARIYTGNDGQLIVKHQSDASGTHAFQQIEEQEIVADTASILALDMPASPLGIAADICMESFCTLLGLVDCWRERALLSLMDRRPKSREPYPLEAVYAAYRRSINSADLRWLTAIVRDLYPANIDIAPDAFYRGAGSIESGLVELNGNALSVSLQGEEFCASMSAPLSALRITASRMENGAVIENSLIGLRGMALFFTVMTPENDGGNVQMKESSLPVLELEIHGMLTHAMRLNRDPHDPQPPAIKIISPSNSRPKTLLKFCSKCGKPMQPAMRFCPACGTSA
jgi:hypothetical protein